MKYALFALAALASTTVAQTTPAPLPVITPPPTTLTTSVFTTVVPGLAQNGTGAPAPIPPPQNTSVPLPAPPPFGGGASGLSSGVGSTFTAALMLAIGAAALI